MNGALFAAFRVLTNFTNMINCSRTTHTLPRMMGMIIYLIYFAAMQILSFFLVGSFFISIRLFYSNFFKQITDAPGFREKHTFIYHFF